MPAFLFVSLFLTTMGLAEATADGLAVNDALVVAAGIRADRVVVYPVIDTRPRLDVAEQVLLVEALATKSLEISERAGSGSVPTLMVHNKGAKPVLITAGEVLKGGKQDRVVTDDVLIAPSDQPIALNVNCVEQGRWSAGVGGVGVGGGGGASFAYGGRGEAELKKVLQEEESQASTWSTVASLNKAKSSKVTGGLAPASGTYMASLDSEEVKKKSAPLIAPLAQGLTGLSGVTGLVVAIDGQIVSAELFGHPALYSRSQEGMLSAIALDSMSRVGLAQPPGAAALGPEQAAAFLRAALAGQHTETEAAGAAIQHSYQSAGATSHQLVADDHILHINIYAD
jgi:hypothetical protein